MTRFYSIVLALWISLALSATAVAYSGGDGSSGTPYQIATLADLEELQDNSTDWDKYFIQTADIDASATSGWDGGAGWASIGNATTYFTGSYDGQGYTIDGLYQYRPSDTTNTYGGFLGYTSGSSASIQNLGLTHVDITGGERVGGLVGNHNGTVSNCFTTGSVVSTLHYAGGLVGVVNGNVSDSYSSATVTNENATTSWAGGLVGYLYEGDITNCYSTGDVSGGSRVGGFLGASGFLSGTVSRCYSTGSVSGTGDLYTGGVGGFVGYSYDAISNCYSRGDVTRSSGDGTYFGAFCGYSRDTIEYSYSTGGVDCGGATDKGFVGRDLSGTYTNNFFDSESSEQTTATGATAQITAQMKTESTFTNAGWTFGDDNWAIDGDTNNGYPYLDGVTPPRTQFVSLTGPATVLKDGLGAFTLTAVDASDQPIVVTEDTVFSLSSDSSGDSTFYEDAAGTTSITSATIPNGSSAVTFYYRDDTFGTPTLTATRDSGMDLGNADKQIRVTGNNALSLDGTDDYVDCGTIELSGSALTFEAWVRPVAFQSDHPYISSIMGEEGTSSTALLRFGDASLAKEKPQFVLYVGGETKLDGNTALSTDVWYHVAATYDGSDMKIYINGEEDASKSQTGDLTAASTFWIGAVSSDRYLNGQMDEVRVWNVARTAAEIRADMHRQLRGNETGLVAYYKMDTGTGTTAPDSSGNGNDGTLSGDPAWQTSGAMSGPGNALDFYRANSEYVDCGTIDLSGSALTLETWINVTEFQSSGVDSGISSILGEEVGFSDAALLRFGDSGLNPNQLQFVLYAGGETKLNGVSELNTDTWYHVAATYDDDTDMMRLYINGKEDASKSQSGAFTVNAAFWIAGNPSHGRYLYGKMDEVRVWNVARTARELRDNMCKSLQGDEPGLVAYYRMDQQAATGQTTLYDQTPNGHDGTLYNMDPTADWQESAAFNTWIGSTGTDWETAVNWSRSSVPATSSPYDNTGLPDYSNGTGYPEGNAPSISGTPTVNHLVLATSAGATLSSGLNVNGNLILENDLTLNDQTITLGSSGYLVEDGGLLVGSSASDSGTITTTRTLGQPASENVGGLGAELTTDWELGETTITRGVAARTGDAHEGITRYYYIDPTTETGTNATLVFHYSDTELNGCTEENLVLYKSEDSVDGPWTQVTATLDTGAKTLTASVTDFSWWTAGASDNPLLVDLVSFTAQGFGDRVTITWETASEIDTAGFHLWRSTTKDGSYTKITTSLIPAEGSATSGATYTYSDTEVTGSRIYYYKLEEVSASGTRTDYGPVSAVVGDASVGELTGTGTIPDSETADGIGGIDIMGTGTCTLTTGKYGTNPAGTPSFTSTGDFWFVNLDNASGITQLTLAFTPAQSKDTVYYWNGSAWVACPSQTFSNDTITVTITAGTNPGLGDLDNLIFALGRESAAIPTLSEWGTILLGLLLLTGAVMVMRRNDLGAETGRH